MWAASDYAAGRPIAQEKIPEEILMFHLAKEFGWTPSQIKKENKKDISAMLTILSIYNKVQNKKNKNK